MGQIRSRPGVSRGTVTVQLVTIEKAAELIGYSEAAINKKITRGVWREGAEWIRAPDGRRLIHIEGFKLWAITNYAVNIEHSAPELLAASKFVDETLGLDSSSTVRGTARRFR